MDKVQSSDKFQVDEFHCLTDILAGRIAAIHPVTTVFKLKFLKLYNKLSYNLLLCYFDKYREITEHEPARILTKNYIHPPLIRRVYAERSPLLQLIKLINDLKNDESDTILQQIEMRNSSYRTFSYNVSMVFLNTYDPVCSIGIKTCYVCQLEAQHL